MINFQFRYFSIVYILFAIIWLNSCQNLQQINETDFAVADTASIGKIFLSKKNNKDVTLTRQGNHWKVNGTHIARPDALKFLLTAIKELRVNRPANKSEKTNAIKFMAAHAVKCELYDRQNKLIKTYYVGQENTTLTGDYFLMDGAEQPYIVNIPGFEGWINLRYFVDELDWRQRTVMAIEPSQIKGIQVQYFDYFAQHSFELQKNNLDKYTILPTTKIDNKKCFKYFETFTQLNAIAFARSTAALDTILAKPHFAEIKLLDEQNKLHEIKFYYAPVSKRTKKQYDDNGKPMTVDSDLYYVINDKHEILIMQDLQIKKVLITPQSLQ